MAFQLRAARMAIGFVVAFVACAAQSPHVMTGEPAGRLAADIGQANVAATDAGSQVLGQGAVCGGRNMGIGVKGSSGPRCADGLVCCFPATGVYDPNAKAFCAPPCPPGTQFCESGCYSPPVP